MPDFPHFIFKTYNLSPRQVGGGPGGRGAGRGKAAAAASGPAPAVEAGYQSDEEDTAVPMSYDEKRQVSGVISVTENYADMPKLGVSELSF